MRSLLLLTIGLAAAQFGPALPGAQDAFSAQQEKTIPGNNPMMLCDDVEVHEVTISSLDVLPNPPEPGSALNIEAVGTVHKAVTNGSYVQVSVKWGYVGLLNQRFDLCDGLKEVNLSCPLAKGTQAHVTKQVELPREIPPGKYHVEARAYSEDGEPLICLEATVQMKLKV